MHIQGVFNISSDENQVSFSVSQPPTPFNPTFRQNHLQFSQRSFGKIPMFLLSLFLILFILMIKIGKWIFSLRRNSSVTTTVCKQNMK